MLQVCNLTLSSPGLLDSSNTLPSTSSVLPETEGQDLWCTSLQSVLEMEAAERSHLQPLGIWQTEGTLRESVLASDSASEEWLSSWSFHPTLPRRVWKTI